MTQPVPTFWSWQLTDTVFSTCSQPSCCTKPKTQLKIYSKRLNFFEPICSHCSLKLIYPDEFEHLDFEVKIHQVLCGLLSNLLHASMNPSGEFCFPRMIPWPLWLDLIYLYRTLYLDVMNDKSQNKAFQTSYFTNFLPTPTNLKWPN